MIKKIISALFTIVFFLIITYVIYYLFINRDIILNSILNFILSFMSDNVTILGVILPVVTAYLLNERSKRKDRLLLENDKQKQQAMIVYQNYLNSFFKIIEDKDFSPDNKNILETRRIMQSQLSLFVPDDILLQLVKIQEIGRKLVYFKVKNNDASYKIIEKESLNDMNKLIALMRKHLMPKTKITGNDIENLLSNDDKFIEFVKKNKNEILNK